MGWPQWTVAGLMGLGVIMSLALDGQSRGPWDFADMTQSVALFALLLRAGGFWK